MDKGGTVEATADHLIGPGFRRCAQVSEHRPLRVRGNDGQHLASWRIGPHDGRLDVLTDQVFTKQIAPSADAAFADKPSGTPQLAHSHDGIAGRTAGNDFWFAGSPRQCCIDEFSIDVTHSAFYCTCLLQKGVIFVGKDIHQRRTDTDHELFAGSGLAVLRHRCSSPDQ